MNQTSSIQNFLTYLRHHPMSQKMGQKKVLLLHDEHYEILVQSVCATLRELAEPSEFSLSVQSFASATAEKLISQMQASDFFSAFYNAFTRKPFHRAGGPEVQKVRNFMVTQGRKSASFADVQEHFYEIFSTDPFELA